MSPALRFPWRAARAIARRGKLLPVLLASALVSCVAVAAVVSMQPPPAGAELHIPVMLYGDGDETMSGLQFDISYDPANFELVGVAAGDAAAGAGKEVILSELIPGEGRILITGFNNAELADGHVATVVFRPLQNGAPTHGIALDQVLASDPFGNSVPIDYEDLYRFPPAAPEKFEDPPDVPQDNEELDDNVEPADPSAGNDSQELPAADTVSGDESTPLMPAGAFGLNTGSAHEAGSGADRPAGTNVSRSGRGALFPGRTQSATPGAPRESYVSGAPGNTGAGPASRNTPQNRDSAPRAGDAKTLTRLSPDAPGALEALPSAHKLALAAPTADAIAGSGTLATDGGTGASEGVPGRSHVYLPLLAAALGPLLFMALMFLRNTVFVRVTRPTWRRPR